MFRPGQQVEFIPKTWDEFDDNLRAALPNGAVSRSVDIITGERFICAVNVMYAGDDPYFSEFIRDGGEIIKGEFGGWYIVRVGKKEMHFYKSVLRLKRSVDEEIFMNCLLL